MQRVLTARKGKSLSRREKVNVIARTLQVLAASAVVALIALSISCGKDAQSEAAQRQRRQAWEEARGLVNKGVHPRSPMSASNESELEAPMLLEEIMQREDTARMEHVAEARCCGGPVCGVLVRCSMPAGLADDKG